MTKYIILWYIGTTLCFDIGYRLLKRYVWPIRILYIERFPNLFTKILEGLSVLIIFGVAILDILIFIGGLI